MKRRYVLKQPLTETKVNKFISLAQHGDLVQIEDSTKTQHELSINIVTGLLGTNWVLTTTDSRVMEYNTLNHNNQYVEYRDYIRHLRDKKGRALFGVEEIKKLLINNEFTVG